MSNIYLERYAVQQTYIDKSIYGNPKLIVVIPCYNETALIASLEALEHCDAPQHSEVTVIVVVNASEMATKEVKRQNQETYSIALDWQSQQHRKFTYHFILDNELPKKHAGVGLARKIGMDEAVRMFEHNDHNGVLLCFDADSQCDTNLLTEVERLFDDKSVNGCSIHFEHPVTGNLTPEVYQGIINYELHLRYYIDGLKYAGFPYAYQTIGSSMAVRSSVYQKQGGMNKRQAGEDFYFLHRIIPLGNFYDLTSTKVIPSPRVSDRVPFGTGKAIGDWIISEQETWSTYNSMVFEELKLFFNCVDGFYKMPQLELNGQYDLFSEIMKSFSPKDEFCQKLEEINKHSTSPALFRKRFYHWFDGFKVLKFIHHARDMKYPDIDISVASDWLFGKINLNANEWNLETKLEKLREIDRKHDLLF